MTATWPSLIALALLFVALPLALWLVRRTPGGLATARHPALAVAAAIAVGARERIAVVRAGEKWLIVGITSQAITTLAELDEAPEGIVADAGKVADGPFGQILRSWSAQGTRRS